MDRDVLERLYVRYYKPAFLYTLSLCGNRELAEDLVAEAFVKAYLSLPEEQASFRYWLLRVCKNLWIDQLRRQKRRDDGGTNDPQSIQATYTPEQQLLRDEKLSYLYTCIRALREPDRELLTLHYLAGMPLGKIAQMLNTTPGSVKMRLFRARQNLKHLIEENDYAL